VEHGSEPRELVSNSEEYTAPGGLAYREMAGSDMAAGIRDAFEQLESPEIASQPFTSWLTVRSGAAGNSELETDRTGVERLGKIQDPMRRCGLGEVKSTNLVFLVAKTMKSNREKIKGKELH
jgi:hypothetical protein